MKTKMFVAAFTALMLFGCGSSSQKSNKETPSPDDQGQGTSGSHKGYALTYTDVMEFTRGVETSYDLSGSFSEDDSSILSVDGLPEGATYENNQITWMPSCELSPENGHFHKGYMIHRLRISLQSHTTDNLIQRPALMIVHLHGEDSTCED